MILLACEITLPIDGDAEPPGGLKVDHEFGDNTARTGCGMSATGGQHFSQWIMVLKRGGR
jgi:hypothetical protein